MKPFHSPDGHHREKSGRVSGRGVATTAGGVLFSLLITGCVTSGGASEPTQAGAGQGTSGSAWQNWALEQWARSATEFTNPVIDGLWNPQRMRDAHEPGKAVDANASSARGVSDPEPVPVEARPVRTPYHRNAAPVGKVFFDSPEGSQTCSGTVVKDPSRPGRSNLVWTAGHCVHAGRDGGWFRNIVFVPSFNDTGRPVDDTANLSSQQLAPFGTWWADWAGTSDEWMAEGTAQGGGGAPFDFAVLHVKAAPGSDGTSLEETVGAALPVVFNGPPVQDVPGLSAWGYPATAPFDGSTMHFCSDEPGRLSLTEAEPTMYRIGCTMTGGSSGGGWFTADSEGNAVLVSNTSIGPDPAVWLAGPYLGDTARSVLDNVSDHVAQ